MTYATAAPSRVPTCVDCQLHVVELLLAQNGQAWNLCSSGQPGTTLRRHMTSYGDPLWYFRASSRVPSRLAYSHCGPTLGLMASARTLDGSSAVRRPDSAGRTLSTGTSCGMGCHQTTQTSPRSYFRVAHGAENKETAIATGFWTLSAVHPCAMIANACGDHADDACCGLDCLDITEWHRSISIGCPP